MTTVKQFIVAKFAKFGVRIPDAEIEIVGINFGFNPDEEYTLSNSANAKLAVASLIPEMILIPNVSEGGYSVSRDSAGLKEYYSMLCTELGIENKLMPKVRNRSNIW